MKTKNKTKVKLNLEAFRPKKKTKLGPNEIRDILSVFVFLAIVVGGAKIVSITREYSYWQNTRDIYSASLISRPVDYSFLKPFRAWNIPALENLSARSSAIMVASEPSERFIFEKNSNKIVPIGSISKLLTAYVTLNNYNLDEAITISEEAQNTIGIRGYFSAGERITVNDLLHSMLIESSNDSAKALADAIGEQEFIRQMNEVVEKIGLQYTYFSGPIGLDVSSQGGSYNYSTARELGMLVSYLLKEAETNEKVATIFEATRLKEYDVGYSDGRFHHTAHTTNRIIEEFPEFVTAKTGHTPLAGQCLIMVKPHPKNQGYVIYVILGSGNRFEDMRKIINWSQEAFLW